MGPWPYTAEFHANGTGEGRFHPDVLKAIKNKNNGSGPPETFPMTWEKIEAKTYSITMLGVTSRDFVLNGDRLTCPRWQHPGERLSKSSNSTPLNDSDRKAAEYVLSVGGKVKINGNAKEIAFARDLPSTPFHLISVNLLHNTKITEAGLKNFVGTHHIRYLELSGAANLTRTAMEYFQENRGLKDLGLAFLKINNDSLGAIRHYPDLTVLWLNETQVTDDGLTTVAKFSKLRLLGLIKCKITDRGLTQLIGHPSLVHVDLRQTEVSDAVMRVAETWPQLEILELEGSRISDRGLADIKNLRKLHHLRLDQSSVTDAGLQKLAENKGLRYLTLHQTGVTPRGIGELSINLPNCEIHWNGGVWKDGKAERVYDVDYQAALYAISVGGGVTISGSGSEIRNVAELPKSPFTITGVLLQGCQKVTDNALAIFEDCQGIVALHLNDTPATDQGLTHFRHCRGLKELGISGSLITGPGLKNLSECENLEKISLWNTRISLNDFLPLAERPFKFLNLGGNTAFTDDWFSHFNHLEDLGFLNLRYTDVSDKGLAPLQDCRKLYYLSLGRTKTTDAGLAYFQNCSSLQELILSETIVTDEGLRLFKNCKKLKNLELEKTKVTAAGIEELKKSHPQCRITWDGGVIEPGKP